MSAVGGVPLLWAVGALIRIAAHPSSAPTVAFSLAGLAALTLAALAVVMGRQRITVQNGRIARRGLLRTQRWAVGDVVRIYREPIVGGWTRGLPLSYIYLADHDGRCIIRVETAWWFPEDAGERLSKAMNLPIYVAPAHPIPGSPPRFVRHPALYGCGLAVPILAIMLVLMAVADQLH